MERVTLWRCPNCGGADDQDRGCLTCIGSVSTYFHPEPVTFVRLDEVVAMVEEAAKEERAASSAAARVCDFDGETEHLHAELKMKDLASQLKGTP